MAFCERGNGRGTPYDPYGFSMRKFRLFGGFLIEEGITVAKKFLPWQAAINHGFAQAELGRPARGFDVAQAMQAWDADQVSRTVPKGASRAPLSEAYVRRLLYLGQVAVGPRLYKIAILLTMVLFGMRAATIGGCVSGDCFWRDGILVFMFRCVKMWPELRVRPARRARRCPRDRAHPRSQVMRVIRRAARADPDFVPHTVRIVHVRAQALKGEQLAKMYEREASSVISGWMRELIPDPARFGVSVLGDEYVASHSPRILLASACDVVPYARVRVRQECFWRSETSQLSYIRPFQYSSWLAKLYDFLA